MNILKKIGIPIVEHCNLNCKGCLHFCNVYQEKFYYDCGEYETDMQRLSQLFDEVELIRIYGGEPLLHPNIIKIIKITRKYFENARLELLTNGLLLGNMNEEFFICLRELNVYIVWSAYPIEERQNRIIEEKLIKEKMNYLKNRVDDFYGIFNPRGDSNPDYQWEHCSGRECHVLRKGFISVCPAPAIEHIINESFDKKLDFSTSRLSIHEKSVNAEIVHDFLERSHDVCKYCSGARKFKWERQKKPVIDEWFGKGENDGYSIFCD